jgi:hypothetical protein
VGSEEGGKCGAISEREGVVGAVATHVGGGGGGGARSASRGRRKPGG